MKVGKKLTDEQLAAVIEHSFGKGGLAFSDIDSFEACTVAEKSMALMDQEALKEDFGNIRYDLSATIPLYEPMAMCGFLGDDSDECDTDQEAEDTDNTDTPDSADSQ